MTFKDYRDAAEYEKKLILAKVNHLINTDETCYNLLVSYIEKAEKQGLFNQVKFNQWETN